MRKNTDRELGSDLENFTKNVLGEDFKLLKKKLNIDLNEYDIDLKGVSLVYSFPFSRKISDCLKNPLGTLSL
jgi:hypothetical protein